MECEKNSESEERDKQDLFLKNKDFVPNAKSKVDLSNILDVSLQGQDYTNGLNAEVDLDENVEKVDDVSDKSDGLNEDENNKSENDKKLNGLGENGGTINDENNSIEESNENGNPDQTEVIEEKTTEQNRESVLDNRDLNNISITEGTMGNNLEVKEGLETSVDDSLNVSCNSVQSDTVNTDRIKETESDKLHLENEKETEAEENEDLNVVNKDGNSDTTEKGIGQEAAANTEEEHAETETVGHETDVDTGNEVLCDRDKNEDMEKELSEQNNENDQEKHEEDGSEIETDATKKDPVEEEGERDISNDINEENVGKIEQEITDREKIQNFIKEVINDLHGIVLETEACDSAVNDLCEESTRSELVGDLEVKSDENECLDTDDNKDPGEVQANKEAQNNKYDESLNIVTDNETDRDLVIDNTDTNAVVSVLDENTANEYHNASVEARNEDSEGLHTVEEQDTAVPSKNTMQVKRKEKNDLKMVEELKEMQDTLKKSQRSFQDERSRHNRDVMTLKLQLYRSQMELKRQKSKSEKQLTEVMSHLMMLESRLRQEQLRLKREAREKNTIIESQKNEIMKLKDQNEQLLNAIKEICAKGGMNGYMRENRRRNGNYVDSSENSAKGTRDKKGLAVGKLGSVKDKFLAKNRSSLELNSFSLEKYLIKDERLCSSQEDLHRLGDERRRSIPTINERVMKNQRHDISPKDRPVSDNSEYKNGNNKKHVRYSQNFFSDNGSPQYEMNKSISESSHLSESSSGVYSLSDHDLSSHNDSVTNGHHHNQDYTGDDDDDDDDRIFSFSSTHINTVIAEEEAMGPVLSHSGQMVSMGSMPMLASLKKDNMGSGKNRPHSLSSVDLDSIQQQAQNLTRLENRVSPNMTPVMDKSTPPTSPSYVQSKIELTPFQTFKTMFRRKGSSKKGHKKRSVSLSQTTNTEYSEALKKHFQKYDMS